MSSSKFNIVPIATQALTHRMVSDLFPVSIFVSPLMHPQLTLAKKAQLARHETVNTRSEHYSPRVEGSIPVRGNFLLNLFCSTGRERLIRTRLIRSST